MNHLIDRRLSGKGKSTVNRERFLRRYKTQVRAAVKQMVGERSIKDMDRGGEVHLPKKDIAEPSFGFGRGGEREFVLPGNKEYVTGDRIPRPKGGGGGNEAGSGDAQDSFVFSLSREEFMHIFFDDLELPRLARTVLGTTDQFKSIRAGYTTQGAPANLSVYRTLTNSLGRRIALGGAIKQKAAEVEAELERAFHEGRGEDVARLEAELTRLRGRHTKLPFLEELDLRYRNRVLRPEPVARAVMFCLMDVSASMDEEKKDLAKRFFTLLYLFLTRKYKQVELVFIRHTEEAEEVDENTFFHDTKSGGTVVLSALEMMDTVRRARYAEGWNVYAAQASDGDAFGSDPAKSARFLREMILPMTRYYAYIELAPEITSHASNLWAEYEVLAGQNENFAMRRAARREDIYPVFRDLFAKTATQK
ncbi:MAG: YeaH/YhbH family protein [Betaproteobacteria bacterium]|nr:YeaH/YhbH family protein [Betaproteobacteria bacterium]